MSLRITAPRLFDRRAVELAMGTTALGLLNCALGALVEAAHCYNRAAVLLGPQSDLRMANAKRLIRAGELELAAPYLAAALESDKTRGSALSYLGCIDHEKGCLGQAQIHLEQAAAQMPSWGAPQRVLLKLYEELAEYDRVKELNGRLSRHCRLNELLRLQLQL